MIYLLFSSEDTGTHIDGQTGRIAFRGGAPTLLILEGRAMAMDSASIELAELRAIFKTQTEAVRKHNLNAAKKNQDIKVRNLWLSVVIFIISSIQEAFILRLALKH
jgi:hypothetical protein